MPCSIIYIPPLFLAPTPSPITAYTTTAPFRPVPLCFDHFTNGTSSLRNHLLTTDNSSRCTPYNNVHYIVYDVKKTTLYVVYSVHCTLHSGRCTLYIVQCRSLLFSVEVTNVRCTLYSVYCTRYSGCCTLYSACTMYTVQCTVYTECTLSVHTLSVHWVYIHYTVYSAHCTVYCVHWSLRRRTIETTPRLDTRH